MSSPSCTQDIGSASPHPEPTPLELPADLPVPDPYTKVHHSKASKLPRMHFFGTLLLEGYRTRSYGATKHDLATLFPARVHSGSDSAQMPPEAS
jgi:hypothetical protein